MVSYTSISSLERSWDIQDVDPYEEAALQAIEQVAPLLSLAYLPHPIELDEHDQCMFQNLRYITDSNPNEDSEKDLKEEENADYANEPKEEDLEEEDPKEEDS
nr:hypothetical protein [Tanacetum cinerariifolium]